MLRFYVRMNRLTYKDEIVLDSQKKALHLIKKLLVLEETVLTSAPISGVYYLEWNDVLVKIFEDRVHIVNGSYFYDITLTRNQYDDFNKFFKTIYENKGKLIEKHIIERTSRTLESIIKEVDTYKQKQTNS